MSELLCILSPFLLPLAPPAACPASSFTNPLILLSAHCKLDVDSGTNCGDYTQRWHFSKALGACSPFWYGGCDGNANRFSSENECFQKCGIYSKSPLQDEGGCQNYTLNKALGACSPFWYGGCDGNANRFSSENECFQKCGIYSKSPLPSIISTGHNMQIQALQLLATSRITTAVVYNNALIKTCSRFWYGGCGGNGNRFETQELNRRSHQDIRQSSLASGGTSLKQHNVNNFRHFPQPLVFFLLGKWV
uniref:BPTI/Kunitz inhibitor domain-containing protein n=1 Tax=Esox lucius TaxID=8010 RepID=A0A6Q2X662_ESOLU